MSWKCQVLKGWGISRSAKALSRYSDMVDAMWREQREALDAASDDARPPPPPVGAPRGPAGTRPPPPPLPLLPPRRMQAWPTGRLAYDSHLLGYHLAPLGEVSHLEHHSPIAVVQEMAGAAHG